MVVSGVLVTGCGQASPLGPRASQGDIALCVYVRGLSQSEAVALKARGEGGMLDDVSDGQLVGLAWVANFKLAGSERNALLARCRELGAL